LVEEVWINDAGGGLCRQGPPIGLADAIRRKRFFISTVAGGIAAARRFGFVGWRGCASDYSLLRAYAFDESERRALWKIAERTVEENWASVCLLARALYVEGRLDRRRTIELLQPSRGGLARRARRAQAAGLRVGIRAA
jgi:hypothetical protein